MPVFELFSQNEEEKLRWMVVFSKFSLGDCWFFMGLGLVYNKKITSHWFLYPEEHNPVKK